MKKTLLIISFLFLSFSFCYAEIIYLKNGTKIEGTIVEETDEFVKIDLLDLGAVLNYNKSDIDIIFRGEYKDSETAVKPPPIKESQIIDSSKYLIYLPAEFDQSKKYPLVVAFSPAADAQSMIAVWKIAADEQKWIVFASKEFRNGVDMNKFFPQLVAILKKLFERFPIDTSKIIVTGFSGGAMASHYFSYLYPDFVTAIVVNTGMMHPDFFKKQVEYPKNKIVVFLASSTDFRYNEMKRDSNFLKKLGWRTKWIEFRGGHKLAPDATYQEAAEWLKYQFYY